MLLVFFYASGIVFACAVDALGVDGFDPCLELDIIDGQIRT